jgi:hypothetical protein
VSPVGWGAAGAAGCSKRRRAGTLSLVRAENRSSLGRKRTGQEKKKVWDRCLVGGGSFVVISGNEMGK